MVLALGTKAVCSTGYPHSLRGLDHADKISGLWHHACMSYGFAITMARYVATGGVFHDF